jgi:hypothetical protein
MTFLFHLAFLGRKVCVAGDMIEYLDGLPPPTEAELDASRADAEAAWNAAQNPPKRWPDAEHFVAEFQLPELAAISLSTDPTVAALRFMLSTWLSPVHSDDPRVQQGLDALVAAGILTPERRSAIVG